MNKNKISLILGIVCFILTIAICIQIKTVEDAQKEVGKTIGNNAGLKDEILQLRDRYNNIYKELENAELELEQARAEAVSNNADDAEKEAKIKQIERVLGKTELKGTGVIIELDDNREISANEILNINDYVVHYYDLLYIVNELFNAGANAISINDQRIVSTTGIICDGSITRVNGEMVGVPITIKAIGFPELLEPQLTRTGGYLDMLKGYVSVKIEKSEDITIPKYEGVYTSEYIK